MMQPVDRWIDVGVRLHVCHWSPRERLPNAAPFLLVHGLASNARTWDGVARHLAERGHEVVAVDQRGHGGSEKPDGDYGFATVSADLRQLITVLGWERPVLAGQSWGGNVMLDFGVRYPGVARYLAFVDGGFLDLQHRNSSWQAIREELAPPNLLGTPAELMRSRIRQHMPEWSDEGIDGTLANFEILDDGTIRPWLARTKHMQILRALWEQRPPELYPRVQEHVLICAADDGIAWSERKRAQVEAAGRGIADASVVWFERTHHDIHIHRPQQLADLLLTHLALVDKSGV